MDLMRVGSMFTGYGGLDMAVLAFYGGSLAWYAEVEPAACKVLAAHHPEVPNLGDVTRIDWTQVEPVDAITAGYPCQPFSHAGKRKGKNDERHLWPYVRDAIGALGPSHVVLENVAGHLSMGLADVVGDLASLGYDARWGVVRAADAKAPHQRARVFIVANAIGERYDRFGTGTPAKSPVSGWPDAQRSTCAPADASGDERWISNGDGEPIADADGAAGAQRDERATGGQPASRRMDPSGCDLCRIDWGQYGPAIRRWERLTRPAPAPTIAGANGKQRLSPSFVEWMMGLPEGHVTGHGLGRTQALKMLGNGVVPQQAYLALGMLA